MRFGSTMRTIRNMQESTESIPSNPYCPQPGAEPPWVTNARKYMVTNRFNSVEGESPTREFEVDERGRPILDKDGNKIWHNPSLHQITIWAATVWKVDIMAEGFSLADVNLDPRNDGWCAAFLGSMLEASGFAHSGSNFATSYSNWGQDCWPDLLPENGEPLRTVPDNPPIGAIAVFGPGTVGGGHVGFIAQDAQDNFRILGGNQSSRVCIADLGWYFRNKTFLGFRWPSDCPCPNAADESGETNGPSSE